MKKLLGLTLVLLLTLLSACGGVKSSSVYDVTVSGKVCTIDTENQTITCGDEVCQYSISGSSSRIQVEITYPDGATYFSTVSKGGSVNSTASGWSDNYREENYAVSGGDLVDALLDGRPGESRSGGGAWFLGLWVIALGVWNVAAPRSAWYIAYGWRYKNAEPSESALFFERVGGIIAIIAGVILFFV